MDERDGLGAAAPDGEDGQADPTPGRGATAAGDGTTQGAPARPAGARPLDSGAAARQRRRSVAILTALGAFLLVSFLLAFAYIQGWFPGGDADRPAAGATPTRSCAPATPAPAPATITVDVYNATDRSGLAATTAKALAAQGFAIGKVGNDPLGKQVSSAAEIRYGAAGEAKAKVVAQRFPGAVLVRDDKRTDDTVDVALGSGFATVAPSVTAAPTPSPSC